MADETHLGGQFSQGALFNVKPTDEHRWPKGYSPERRRDVEQWLSVRGPQRDMAGVGVKAHEIRDALLRSSMPSFPGMGDRDLSMRVGGTDEKAAGRYYGGGNAAQVYTGNAGTTLPEAEMTALHEMGHHYSYVAGTPHALASSRWNPESRGIEEAYADDFMTRHYVPRRTGPRMTPGQHTAAGYESPSTWREDYTESPGISHSAYMGARQTKPEVARQIEEANAEYERQGKRPQHIPVRLFGRDVDSRFTDTERDYGQWSSWATGGEDLEKIKVGRGVPPRSERMLPGVPKELTPEVIDEGRGVPEYKQLAARRKTPITGWNNQPDPLGAYTRYGDYRGVHNAIEDWKKGEFR